MWNMEGLILIGFCEADYRKLRDQMHISFVVYDGFFEETDKIVNLTIDHYDGGYQAGQYLKEMGHKRAICIADNFIDGNSERELLAVLSHEIGHLKHKKNRRNIIQYGMDAVVIA